MKGVRILAIAYAGSALFVFLQSLVLRAIPYDAAWFDTAAFIVRLAFFAADAVTFAALLVLARREPLTRGFAAVATFTSGYAVVSGLLTMTVSHVEAFAATTSSIEETMSFATTILVGLLFAALAKDREVRLSRIAIACFVVALALSAMLGFARAVVPEARTVGVAWFAWAVHVAVPLTLAVLAWPLVRSPNAQAKTDAPALGGYRSGPAIVAADAPKPRAEDVPPDPATVGILYQAVRGLALYRGAFLARVIAFIALLPIGLLVATVTREEEGLYVTLLLPLAGAVTGIMMTIGVARQRALPTLRGGVLGAIAIGAFGVSAFIDLVTLLAALGASRNVAALVLVFPGGTFVAAVAVSLLVRILGSAGEQLGQDDLARTARWTQALIVFVVTALAAAFFGSASMGARYGGARDAAVFLVVVMTLLAFGASIAVVVQHLKVVGEALRIFRTRLALAPRIGSPPGP